MLRLRPIVLGLAALVSLCPSLGGCFFYDSSWGQAKQSQKSVAEERTPQALTSEGEGPSSALAQARVVRVRAYATARHAAEVHDWPRRMAATLDDANPVLAKAIGVRLELADTGALPVASDESLAAMLTALVAHDAGDDVGWVIGLAGSVPRFELSFHELGMGQMPGKHLVLRAMSDARELDAIHRDFGELSAKERDALAERRRRHKGAAVLLHELGHTLGAPHAADPTAILSPRYDARIVGFDAQAAELMRFGLGQRELPPDERGGPAYARGMIGLLTRDGAPWDPRERDELVGRLRAEAEPAAVAPAATIGAADGVAALSAQHRAAYERALSWEKQDRPREAWAEATPLFATYADVLPVQDLRCRIAMKLFAFREAKTHCEAVRRLSVPGH